MRGKSIPLTPRWLVLEPPVTKNKHLITPQVFGSRKEVYAYIKRETQNYKRSLGFIIYKIGPGEKVESTH